MYLIRRRKEQHSRTKKEINKDTAITFHSPPSNCYDDEQREVCRVGQPPERGIIDAAREWVSTRSRRISVVDRAITFHSPPSNCYDDEQREVCRVGQPPERGIIDAAREWVSTRSRRISVVDRASHWTIQSVAPPMNQNYYAAAFKVQSPLELSVAGVVCHLLEAAEICCWSLPLLEYIAEALFFYCRH
nr:hypothetical protein Itr_chr11CG14090 [Ipomoea trifida]GMD09126.1 hypothetical protein Iba_chr06dCG5150 [Ipomoea batatas]GMD50165.1 hypothetical protein Iba_chr11aCG10020 [Ipomoea batatas]